MIHLFRTLPDMELICAENAEAGLELALSEQPALILMDIHLPGMNGYEALEALRNHRETAEIPVIALSSFAMADDIEKGLAAGFAEYVTKPIDIKAFISLIDKMVRRSPVK
ncbi:response regulator [Paenibacillus aurantius]|uniref:Response regulator n=2 Tax=Paenibacillus aurantius TaxID=2918900 RepID=A0AA96RCX7_9BACL|nr:response regulator [Paenibacillus aurantius]WNQ09177.1 response regulator [Paenibacillus aurantius]